MALARMAVLAASAVCITIGVAITMRSLVQHGYLAAPHVPITIDAFPIFSRHGAKPKIHRHDAADSKNGHKPLLLHDTNDILSGTSPISSNSSLAPAALLPLAFTALNFYHIRDGRPGLAYPWVGDATFLVEPHRETALSAIHPREGFEYRWEVRDGSAAGTVTTAAANGAKAVALFTRLDENVIKLEEVRNVDGEMTRWLEETVLVKYVRREIRTLTDDEREELLDTVGRIWGKECEYTKLSLQWCTVSSQGAPSVFVPPASGANIYLRASAVYILCTSTTVVYMIQ